MAAPNRQTYPPPPPFCSLYSQRLADVFSGKEKAITDDELALASTLFTPPPPVTEPIIKFGQLESVSQMS